MLSVDYIDLSDSESDCPVVSFMEIGDPFQNLVYEVLALSYKS